MENQVNPTNNLVSQPKNASIDTGGESKLLKILLILLSGLFLIFIVIASFLIYQKQKITEKIISTRSSETYDLLPEWKTYVNSENDYQFNYPPNWEVLENVPDNYMYVHMFNNLIGQEGVDWYNTEEGRDKWLSGKMFSNKNCRGTILQNKDDMAQLIAFDINKEKSEEPTCFSAGVIFENTKWKVADGYIHPIKPDDPGTPTEVKWLGDYIIIKNIEKGQDFSASSALTNRETMEIRGEPEFDQILSTFKFLD